MRSQNTKRRQRRQKQRRQEAPPAPYREPWPEIPSILGELTTLCPQPRQAFASPAVFPTFNGEQSNRLGSPWSVSTDESCEELRELLGGGGVKDGAKSVSLGESRPLSSVSTSAGPTPGPDERARSPWTGEHHQYTPSTPNSISGSGGQNLSHLFGNAGQGPSQPHAEGGFQTHAQAVSAARGGVTQPQQGGGPDMPGGTPSHAHKVFVGGIPQDLHQDDLYNIFSQFAGVKKARLQRYRTNGGANAPPPHAHRGFGFVIFYDGNSVDQLLGNSFSRFIVLPNGRKLEVKRAVSINDMAGSMAGTSSSHGSAMENVSLAPLTPRPASTVAAAPNPPAPAQTIGEWPPTGCHPTPSTPNSISGSGGQYLSHGFGNAGQGPSQPHAEGGFHTRAQTGSAAQGGVTHPQQGGGRDSADMPGGTPSHVHKVFVGGIPQDLHQDDLYTIFNQFADVKKAWLQRYRASGSVDTRPPHAHRGFGFVIFSDGNSVEQLLGNSVSRFIVLPNGRKLEVKRAVSSGDMAGSMAGLGSSHGSAKEDVSLASLTPRCASTVAAAPNLPAPAQTMGQWPPTGSQAALPAGPWAGQDPRATPWPVGTPPPPQSLLLALVPRPVGTPPPQSAQPQPAAAVARAIRHNEWL